MSGLAATAMASATSHAKASITGNRNREPNLVKCVKALSMLAGADADPVFYHGAAGCPRELFPPVPGFTGAAMPTKITMPSPPGLTAS